MYHIHTCIGMILPTSSSSLKKLSVQQDTSTCTDSTLLTVHVHKYDTANCAHGSCKDLPFPPDKVWHRRKTNLTYVVLFN